jgi:gliding motility-associated-like protein
LVVASGGQGGYSFDWSNGQSGSLLSEVDAGNYSLSITDNAGCVISGTVSLGCTPLIPLITPQFLSPNNDGKNDVWIIQNIEFYPDNKVTVYNRWGNIVFEAEPYANDWNGHYKGKAGDSLPASTYFYVVDTKKKSQDPFTGYIEIQP